MDGSAVTILVAIIGSVGLVVAALVGALVQTRRIGQRPGGGLAAKWRELHDEAVARAELMEEQRDDEHRFRVELEAKLETTRTDLDNCVRQRDDAFSDLRAAERRRRGQAVT